VSQTCSEPLVWTCKACGHAFQEKEWMEAGRSCPVCENKAGHWKCSLCQSDFRQPSLGKEHACLKRISPAISTKPAQNLIWRKYAKQIGFASFAVALGLCFFWWKRSGGQEESSVKHHAESPAPKITEQAQPESTKNTQQEEAHITIIWSPLLDYRLIKDEEAGSNYFFLLWSSSSSRAAHKANFAYLGLIHEPPFSNRIRGVLQSLDKDRPSGIPDWYPHKLVSIGRIGSITGNATEIFNSKGGLLGISKAIGIFANKSKMTCVGDYEGRDDGSFSIGLLSPINLNVDMMNFPASNIEVPSGEMVSLTIPFR